MIYTSIYIVKTFFYIILIFYFINITKINYFLLILVKNIVMYSN